ERILMLSHIDAQEQIEDLRKRLSRRDPEAPAAAGAAACRPLRRRPAAARARRRPAGRQRCALLGGGAAVWHDVGPYAAGRTPPVARTAAAGLRRPRLCACVYTRSRTASVAPTSGRALEAQSVHPRGRECCRRGAVSVSV
ncbi:unnamed protein product, partial [Prorocentrum cordatum]